MDKLCEAITQPMSIPDFGQTSDTPGPGS